MSVPSSTFLTPNVNFKKMTQHPGQYRYLRVPLNNAAGANVTLDGLSSSLLEWKLPNVVYNLSKSLISYNITLAPTALKAIIAFNDTLEIAQSISFGTASGLNLVDVQNVNNYIAVARKIDTDSERYLGGDLTGGLVKSDVTTTNIFPPGYLADAGNIFGLTTGATYTAPTSLEPQYVRTAVVAAGLESTKSFPLSAITGTLFSMPQDQYFGDNMYLRIQTAPFGKVAYNVATLPTTNTAAGAATALTPAPVVRNLYLYLAVEKDPVCVDSILSIFQEKKLSYTIPFTYLFRYGAGTGQQSIQVQLNSQYGRLLKRILYTVFPATETFSSSYDHSNWSGSKIVSYQTFLDSQPLQDSVVSCVQTSAANPGATMDDFRENRDIIKRSGVITNPASYQNNWFHCDEFSKPSFDPLVADSNIVDGLDLTLPKAWSVQCNAAIAGTHYVWGQFLRVIDVTPTGPQFI